MAALSFLLPLAYSRLEKHRDFNILLSRRRSWGEGMGGEMDEAPNAKPNKLFSRENSLKPLCTSTHLENQNTMKWMKTMDENKPPLIPFAERCGALRATPGPHHRDAMTRWRCSDIFRTRRTLSCRLHRSRKVFLIFGDNSACVKSCCTLSSLSEEVTAHFLIINSCCYLY